MKETFEEFKRRLHTSQIDFDQLANWYWQERRERSMEYEDALLRNQNLMIELAKLRQEIEDNHVLWCDCTDNGDLIRTSCLVCDLIKQWNPEFIEKYRGFFGDV